ncbi:MAG: four-carbon acid sugar kinase family protein [Cyanobacteria bacterium J06639_1]
MTSNPKIVVLDDDPTGSQTVHGCLLLMRWDVETLRLGLRDESPIFFVLTNTRSLTPERAAAVTRDVCQNLKVALEKEAIADFLVVSRSDSTLRGHYPVETDVIAEELGAFDAHFLVPAFFEGGRVTRESVHYLFVDGKATPVHETEFARDSVFGYTHSYLPDYVEEKTKGRIAASDVERFVLSDIRAGSLDRLRALSGNQCGVVDGETQADLDRFARDLLAAASQGKRFLLRSAASILTALANLPPQPVPGEAMSQYARDGRRGVVLVGSHVRKTTTQLMRLLEETDVRGIEVEVSRLLGEKSDRDELLAGILAEVEAARKADKTPVVYTSRTELTFDDVQTRLEFGDRVSTLLMNVVQNLPKDTGFLISKGGITSNDTLSKGLALQTTRLLGQVLPGISMVKVPDEHPEFPTLPVVLFPGNVGDADALATVHRRLNSST